MTRRYGKPTFGLDEIEVDGVVYPILEDIVWGAASLILDRRHIGRCNVAGARRTTSQDRRCPKDSDCAHGSLRPQDNRLDTKGFCIQRPK